MRLDRYNVNNEENFGREPGDGAAPWYTKFSQMLIFLPLFITAFAGGLFSAPHLMGTGPSTSLAQDHGLSLTSDQIMSAYSETLAHVYEKNLPSVVKLEVIEKAPSPSETDISSSSTPAVSYAYLAQGSGFVWDKDGHIVTNFHVIQSAEQIEVIFADGTRLEGEILGSDPNTDLAVIKVDLPSERLIPVTLGDSSKLKVGQLTLAIGSPLGQEFTMTSGIISAMGRTVQSCDSCYPVVEAIQTDTPINPGNSGGPLLNQRGEVIGINTWIITRNGNNVGIGFALSSDIMRQVIPTLINNE